MAQGHQTLFPAGLPATPTNMGKKHLAHETMACDGSNYNDSTCDLG